MSAESFYIYITPFFPSPDNWRGAYCYDFVKELSRQFESRNSKGRRSLRVLVFVPGLGQEYEVGGIHVYRFPVKELPSGVFPFLFRRRNEAAFLQKLKVVLSSLSRVKPSDAFSLVSVCHGHTARFAIYPLALKRVNPKCRTLLHHHDLQSFGLNLGILRHCDLYNACLFRKFRALFEQIDCHVFISEASRKSFQMAPDASWTDYADYRRQMRGPRFFRCRPVRMKDSIILHNGVDVTLFSPGQETVSKLNNDKILKVLDGQFVIGCVGNFIELKDQACLIRAIAKLGHEVARRIKVVFIGSGPRLAYCRQLAERLGVTAEFCSEVRHEQLPDFYRGLDLFVLPSYFEGLGCVYLEAWACGVPFIACARQGIEDYIADVNRVTWLILPGDVEGLAGRIRVYMDSRPRQCLCCPVDEASLVRHFIDRDLRRLDI